MEVYNKRINKIIEQLLQSSKPLNAGCLALKLEVSTKTVRSDMKVLADILKPLGVTIGLEKGAGYHLLTDSAEALERLHSYCSSIKKSEMTENIIPSNPEERKQYIISLLLLNELEFEKTIHFYDLADMLFVSESTLKNDLKAAEKSLAKYRLKISQSQEKGIHIKGEETNIRYCISEFIYRR